MGEAGGARTSTIRTPDQRLRVFVSSTLKELEAERRAVRTAVERLRLAPVMFELGARPHPPRDLYRAYLDQSDVFVGIYAERYGWIAPGEEISGLEDEYRLAPAAMPKLIYIKDPAERDDRLRDLIGRIRADDSASYKSYGSVEELADLVQADLATLLAERFDASRSQAQSPAQDAPVSHLPSPYTRLIGRDAEVAAVLRLLGDRDRRLVTLLGPGGIGKSRLAIAVAAEAAGLFPDGTVFVPLENVFEPHLVLPTIGYALGVRDAGDLPLEQRLSIALEGRRLLLVLDNFEQLVDAAPVIVQLYTIAPEVSFLVTSRVLLRVRGEQVFEVPALSTHDSASPDSVARARSSAAVELFVDRARAVKPDFEVTDANAAAVVGLCRALQGLPLAIELAAARVRVLTPADILRRLDQQLPVLVDSSRDLPERQRTLRSTIEWSTGLLAETERRMLVDLAVFSQSFSFASLETFGRYRGWDFDEFTALENLVDSSLVERDDVEGESAFSLLATVREFGIDGLREQGQEDAARAAHARVFTELALQQSGLLTTDRGLAAVARLNLERGNLRTTVRHLIASGDLRTAADLAWRLYQYWWVGGYIMEVATWMEELRDAAGDDLDDRSRAVADYYIGWRDMWTDPSPAVSLAMRRTADRFDAAGDRLGVAMSLSTAGLAEVNTASPDIPRAIEWMRAGAVVFADLEIGWGEAFALVALGRIAWLTGDSPGAIANYERAAIAAQVPGGEFAATVANHHLGRMMLFEGRLDESERLFLHALEGSVALHHDEGIAYGLEGLCAIAAERGEVDRAGVLAGASAAIRKRTAVFDSPVFVFHTRYIARLAEGGEAERFHAAVERGREYGTTEAAEYALAGGRGIRPGTLPASAP